MNENYISSVLVTIKINRTTHFYKSTNGSSFSFSNTVYWLPILSEHLTSKSTLVRVRSNITVHTTNSETLELLQEMKHISANGRKRNVN